MRVSVETVSQFGAAIDQLEGAVGKVNQAAFEELRTITEVARENMQRARDAVRAHIKVHGC